MKNSGVWVLCDSFFISNACFNLSLRKTLTNFVTMLHHRKHSYCNLFLSLTHQEWRILPTSLNQTRGIQPSPLDGTITEHSKRYWELNLPKNYAICKDTHCWCVSHCYYLTIWIIRKLACCIDISIKLV